MQTDEKEIRRAERAKKVKWIGMIVNVVLSAAKIVAGIFGKSGAMIADGIHSVSDSVTDIIVLVFIGVAAKGENPTFRYGHGKFETFATMLISVALMAVAAGMFVSSASLIIDAFQGRPLPRPTFLALTMALISIAVKEWLFRYTRIAGEHINSMALVANAWHHRSDAFSSIAVAAGISCAMFLGDEWRVLDPIAAAVVSLLIALVAYRLLMPSVRELLEVSLSKEETREIGAEIAKTDGINAFHHLRTRKNGNVYILDFHIKVAPSLTVVAAHDIADRAEKALKKKYGQQTIVNIHIEPYLGEKINVDKSCDD